MKANLSAPNMTSPALASSIAYPYFSFQSTGAPSYDSSGMSQAASLLSKEPQTAEQMTQSGLAAEKLLPEDLRVSGTQFSPEERARWENFYRTQYLNPKVAQQKTDLYQSGRANSTFGAATLGQALAQGEYEAMKAGEDMYNSRFNQQMQRRQSFFGNEGRLAETSNQLGMQNRTNLANMYMQDSQNKNQMAFNTWQAQNDFRLKGAQFNWNKNTDLWNRDNDLYNRAKIERDWNAEQNAQRTQALASGGGAIGGGVRNLF